MGPGDQGTPVSDKLAGVVHLFAVPDLDASEAEPVADEDDDYDELMKAAGRFLSRRSHSEAELRQKLGRRSDPAVIDRVVARLYELELLDDAAFAAAWVEERGDKKGRRALESELRGKGVASDVIAEALSGLDEVQRSGAVELATRYLRRVSHKPLREQASAIQQMLARRGYDYEVAEAAVTQVLPPEGWD
ncbi:MAG: regulatory protein RecX [Actinomycetota bacterium]